MRCFAIAILLLSSSLAGCVATAAGGKKLDPLEGAKRTDERIDSWLEGGGYPTHHTAPRSDPTAYPGSQG